MKNVVFDTNFYRGFVKDKSENEIQEKIKELKLLEFENGFLPFSNTHVTCELLKHLYDDSTRDFLSCKMALYAQFLHCSIKDKRESFGVHLRSVHYRSNAIRNFFYQQIEKDTHFEFQKSVENFLKELMFRYSDENICIAKKNFEQIHNEFIQNRKDIMLSFGDGLMKYFQVHSLEDLSFTLQNDSNTKKKYIERLKSNDFDKSVSFSFLGIEIQNDDIISSLFPINIEEFDKFTKEVKPAIEFVRKFHLNLVNGLSQQNSNQRILENDTHKRWNTMIDIPIIIESLMANALLITEEVDIRNSFAVCGRENQVMKSEEYFDRIRFTS